MYNSYTSAVTIHDESFSGDGFVVSLEVKEGQPYVKVRHMDDESYPAVEIHSDNWSVLREAITSMLYIADKLEAEYGIE